MSGSLFGPSTTPASYILQRPTHTSNNNSGMAAPAGTATEVTVGGAATLGIITTCNYYATIIGYITVLVVGYLIMSWIMSFFGSGSSKKKECDDDEGLDDIEDEDEERPKRRRKKRE
jgi:hypothetical protein